LNFLNIDSAATLLYGVMLLAGVISVIPALTLHEWAHAAMANRLGDPTARMLGRMSINPLVHIDPIGTVLFPIGLLVISLLTFGAPFTFGWAKPVPFNPRYLKNPKRDTALVGIAGPAMNVLLFIAAAFVFAVLKLVNSSLVMTTAVTGQITGLTILGWAIALFCYINLLLCFFNLLPIPPFDGSRIVQKFLRGQARQWYAQLEPYGMWIVVGLLFVLPMMTGGMLDPIRMYFGITVWPIFELLMGVPVNAIFTLPF